MRWHGTPCQRLPRKTARDTWNVREGSVEMWVSMVGDPRDCPPAQPVSVGAEASTGKLGGSRPGGEVLCQLSQRAGEKKFRGQTWIHRPARE